MLAGFASDSQIYLSSDKNGATRVTSVQEGDVVFIVVADNDENIDCDVRDKIWTDLKIMDPKTGAYIVWVSYMNEDGDAEGWAYNDDEYEPYKGHSPGTSAGWLGADYLEETGPDTGIFVSKRSFQIGTRENYNDPFENTHVVDDSVDPINEWPYEFQWGNFLYCNGDTTNDARTNIEADDRKWIDAEWNENDAYAIGEVPGGGPGSDGFFPSEVLDGHDADWHYLIGRFENMDTLVLMYVDPNDPSDVAIGMAKIKDTEATISWNQKIYPDANGSATITIVDPDENLNCNQIEYVPVFIIVNPGSWNPVRFSPLDLVDNNDPPFASPTNFCSLKLTGGVAPVTIDVGLWAYTLGDPLIVEDSEHTIRWYNIYDNALDWSTVDPAYADGAYYMEYPTPGEGNVTSFDTVDAEGFCRVSFHAQETEVNSGVFQLNLNQILEDLEFNSLRVRDVLVAYYLDPNDEDDFKLATAYIEEFAHSETTFTDATRAEQDVFWLGRDPIYVQVVDANANVDPCCPEQVVVHICDPHGEDDSEYVILDEVSSNAPVFFTFYGMRLVAAWDAMGIGLNETGPDASVNDGGFQIQWDNWRFEAFNEDDVFVRYNDVTYELGMDGLAGLGDQQAFADVAGEAAFPPAINRVRVANDVSFDTIEIADTQVVGFDGSVNMWFLDRSGSEVSGYISSDCLFIKVLDPDQDEDQYRRERISGRWDERSNSDGQNTPFGPRDDLGWDCGPEDRDGEHGVNDLLGYVAIFDSIDDDLDAGEHKIYVLNPRNGYWAPVDLLETGVATGEFVSTICIDLIDVYECVPTLGVLPGDTIIAVYQDPSNHSDSAWVSIKVGIGGGGTPPSQASTTMFVDSTGADVANYMDADLAYVKVIDPSQAGAASLENAVVIDGDTYDLTPLAGAANDTFITAGLALGFAAGDTITATYTDPTDPTDVSDDTITIIASELAVGDFYATPNPFEGDVEFTFDGTGIASVMSVEIYDLAGGLVWSEELTNVTGIVWDGTDENGAMLANGGYIYVIMATDGTNTFDGKGTVFIRR